MMDKQDMGHIQMEYYCALKKYEIMLFAATCMDLEIITLSELSQGKTNYHLIALISGIFKKWNKRTSLQKEIESRGNYIQYLIITYYGKESEEEYILTYV